MSKKKTAGAGGAMLMVTWMAVVSCADPITMVATGPVPVRAACAPEMRTVHPYFTPDDSLVSTLRQNGYCQLHIPEYHDEQRLRDGDGDLGPIAYAFASPNLIDFTSHDQFDDGWVNVGIVDISAESTEDVPKTYEEMGFAPGTNCVYFHHDHDFVTADDWEAIVAPPQSGRCSGATGKALRAVREEGPEGLANYPPVARFVERSNGNGMVGFRCADGWCIVGTSKKGNVPTSAHHDAAEVTAEMLAASSRWSVKGWFDDQHLGVKTVEGRHGILPYLRASLVPHNALADQELTDFSADWVEVAYVYIPRQALIPEKYSFVVRDDPGDALPPDTLGYGLTYGLNIIEMTGSATEGCSWKARIKNRRFPDGLVRKVCRVDHGDSPFDVPATARWRWLDSDEKIWVRCDRGCCMVEDEST